MKQIPFTLEAFGPDGMLKEGYEVRYRDGQKPDFVKKYYEDNIVAVDRSGYAHDFGPVGNYLVKDEHEKDLILYRRHRTAEEVAREYFEKATSLKWGENNGGPFLRDLYKGFVQAGMDEMREP